MLPRQVTINTAAALTGRSAKAIRKLVDDGVLPSIGGNLWQRIPLAAVEKLLGRKITPEIYMQAQAGLEQTRQYYRNYSEQRRARQIRDVGASGTASP